MFSAVNEPATASVKLMKNIDNVGLLANQCTMSFNPDSPSNCKKYCFHVR